MSGRYLYCQNPSCGVYLGCSGGDNCDLCGWSAGRDTSEDEPCEACGDCDCNGECMGDGQMGD